MLIDRWLFGPLMDEAGADGGDAGGGGGGGDIGTDLAVIDHGTDVATTAEETPADTGTQITAFDGRGQVTQHFRKALAPLGKSAGMVYRDLGTASKLKGMFPGKNPVDAVRGLQTRVQELESTIQEIGGFEGDTAQSLEQIRFTLQDSNELDTLYADGDPRMIEKMTQTPQGKAAFAKIMPVALGKWKQSSPNAYWGHVAQTMLSQMREDMQIPMRDGSAMDVNFLFDLQDLIRQTPKTLDQEGKIHNPAVAALSKVMVFIENLKSVARQPPEVPEVPKEDATDALAGERQQLAKDRMEIVSQRLSATSQSAANQAFAKIYGAAVKGRNVKPEQLAEIQANVSARTTVAINADAAHSGRVQSYAKNNDQQGYLRYMTSIYEKNYKAFVPKYVDLILGAKRGPAPGGAPVPASAGAVDTGWTRINYAELQKIGIDHRKGTMVLFEAGKAYGNDGKKYQWRNFK